jgi:hypothetical protein
VSKFHILQTENALLREELDTLRGTRQPYRAIEKATGDVRDFATPQRLMDWLFAVGGFVALRRFWVYKERRRVRMPQGGEVSEIAIWLEEQ